MPSSTLWTMTLVHVSCLPTAEISLSNFSICALIVAMCGATSSLVNRFKVVRVRLPRLFHWIPEMRRFVGALLWRRILLIASHMWWMSASVLISSLFLWTTMVRSVFLGGPLIFSFSSCPFLATLAQVPESAGCCGGGGGSRWECFLVESEPELVSVHVEGSLVECWNW